MPVLALGLSPVIGISFLTEIVDRKAMWYMAIFSGSTFCIIAGFARSFAWHNASAAGGTTTIATTTTTAAGPADPTASSFARSFTLVLAPRLGPVVGIFLSENACQEGQEVAPGAGAAPIASISTTTSAPGPARSSPAALLGTLGAGCSSAAPSLITAASNEVSAVREMRHKPTPERRIRPTTSQDGKSMAEILHLTRQRSRSDRLKQLTDDEFLAAKGAPDSLRPNAIARAR
ncbi:hypothetical protein DL764_007370 [Monosporascus ibericus]|uniref:Uncharacterized protein n=1 Tax=Monosporascus ibericus TaxID=155417 RepID=A0A4Q4T4Z4_9PEZI|nr:hypothetical protein DL764_007370 [Monosporascus ibericus]